MCTCQNTHRHFLRVPAGEVLRVLVEVHRHLGGDSLDQQTAPVLDVLIRTEKWRK